MYNDDQSVCYRVMVGIEDAEKQCTLGQHRYVLKSLLFIDMELCPCYLTFLNLRFLIFKTETIIMILFCVCVYVCEDWS